MDLNSVLAKLPQVEGVAGLREVPRDRKRPELRLDVVFALLSSSAAAVLLCDDDPATMDGAEGTWTEIAPGQWRLPEDEFDVGEVLDWLASDNWSLVGFPEGVAVTAIEAVDLFGAPEPSAEVLRAAGACWALDVFLDEAWRVLLP